MSTLDFIEKESSPHRSSGSYCGPWSRTKCSFSVLSVFMTFSCGSQIEIVATHFLLLLWSHLSPFAPNSPSTPSFFFLFPSPAVSYNTNPVQKPSSEEISKGRELVLQSHWWFVYGKVLWSLSIGSEETRI